MVSELYFIDGVAVLSVRFTQKIIFDTLQIEHSILWCILGVVLPRKVNLVIL